MGGRVPVTGTGTNDTTSHEDQVEPQYHNQMVHQMKHTITSGAGTQHYNNMDEGETLVTSENSNNYMDKAVNRSGNHHIHSDQFLLNQIQIGSESTA